ncbi:MAG: double zinc ribbon domain-containing protein [Ghiorsea sp.]
MTAMFMPMAILSMHVARIIQASLFPEVCPLCTKTIKNSDGCCATCLQNIQTFPIHTCLSCGIPLSASLAPGPCGRCLSHRLPQAQTQHLYVYDGVVRDAILAWKLEGNDVAMKWLLNTAKTQIQNIFSPHDLLLPVPMPLYRMRRSGIHHSADLCKLISCIVGCKVDWQILRRKKDDIRQSSLQGKARQRNLKDAFKLSEEKKDKILSRPNLGKVWVIDDILTTGATLRHACQTVKQLKRPVFAFSFARVWHH